MFEGPRSNLIRNIVLFFTTCAVLSLVRFETWPGQLSTKVFWGAVLVSALMLPGQSRLSSIVSLFMMVAAGVAAAITTGAYFRQSEIMVFGPSETDILAGSIGIALTIYCTWRWGARPLAVLAAIFLAFALWGSYLPAGLGHSPIDLSTLVNHLYIGTEGIFGIALNVILHVVFVFIVLTALLEVSGGSGAVVALSMKLFGKSTGAPGKVSVAASALFGTMTGAAVANVIASGSITIPMMKKSGYRSSEAAAIESVASTGSQIMPPVLGSAGFIMAELLQLPFSQILIAATLPALFYYVTLFAAVHANRRHLGTEAVALAPGQELKSARGLLLLAPIGVLLLCLLGLGFTASNAALYAILSAPVSMLLATGRLPSLPALALAAVNAARMMVPIGLLGASAGIIIGVFSLTGLGQKLVNAVLIVSDGNLILVLLLTMITSIVLGMGLPTVAVYIILALTVAPAMIQADIVPLVAHFFVFYYGVLAAITPPVALATIAAASVADASIWKTGWLGIKLAVVPYALPFLFVLQPGLLGLGEPVDIGLAIVVAGSFSVFAVVTTTGYLVVEVNKGLRCAFAVLAGGILIPEWQLWSCLVGDALYFALIGYEVVSRVLRRRSDGFGKV
ncbi:TRAP transporter fused permease subunit [Marinovum sp.]|uniref:TRAP transporter permease n=1 Tax=Marinovum sp. TaxID=2024839 RepID=UPI002B27A75D|nr:TRAP transporter fused permease subunit [Marinovum sp.]